jgi:hypothetical protein
VVNWWLADKYVASRLRLQDLPKADLSLNVPRDYPVLGRCFALYYNPTRLGTLEIHPAYKYTTETPKVHGQRADRRGAASWLSHDN